MFLANALFFYAEQGKDILHFEEKMGPLLFNTFPRLISRRGSLPRNLLKNFLSILLNMIKFNPAYLDPEVVCGLISYLGHICVLRESKEIIELCLQVSSEKENESALS